MNCMGGTLYHDLGFQFLSPTINLWFSFDDFVRLCSNLESYFSKDLRFLPDQGLGYPVAALGDVRVYFQHYATNSEARESWARRIDRVNLDNVFVMGCDRDGFRGEASAEAFETIPFEHKVLFTSKAFPQPSVHVVPGFSGEPNVGIMTEYCDIFGHRYYEQGFDVVGWLNGVVSPDQKGAR